MKLLGVREMGSTPPNEIWLVLDPINDIIKLRLVTSKAANGFLFVNELWERKVLVDPLIRKSHRTLVWSIST